MSWIKILGQWVFELLALYVLQGARKKKTQRTKRRVTMTPPMNGSN